MLNIMATQQEQNNQEILRQKIAESFPDADQTQILALLNEYQSESATGRLRVQLAVLKLSLGDLGKLRQYVETARTDYRDVLFWAETPQQAARAREAISQWPQPEAHAKFRRFVWLLLLEALIIIVLGVRLTTTFGEKMAMVGIFLLAGVSIYWRIQTGRL
jgi:lipopolysaccharide export LptBFGC system permease protein LptF